MRRAIIVVPAAELANANAKAAEVDTVGGSRAFTIGLSATGAAPATHYWCSWACTDAVYTALSSRFGAGNLLSATMHDGVLKTPEQVLADHLLKVIL